MLRLGGVPVVSFGPLEWAGDALAGRAVLFGDFVPILPRARGFA